MNNPLFKSKNDNNNRAMVQLQSTLLSKVPSDQLTSNYHPNW